jgi:single-strand DNA-binding protein
MPDTTTTTVCGNLTNNPELRYTTSGAALCTFTVAVTPRRPDGKGGFEDGDTSFLRVACWRSLAEHVNDSLTKGDRVLVYGRLQQRSWDTDAGEKRSVVEVQAEEVGPSLKWATAKPEKVRANATAKADQFDDEPPF